MKAVKNELVGRVLVTRALVVDWVQRATAVLRRSWEAAYIFQLRTEERGRLAEEEEYTEDRRGGGETLLYGGKGKNFNVKYVIYGITG